MVCIYCGTNTSVTNSRLQRRNNHTWRRRACSACKSVFTTIETPELTGSIMVSKPGSVALEPFSRDKLFLSIYRSCQHRDSAIEDASGLTQIIIANLRGTLQDASLQTRAIAEAAHTALHRFDRTAATVYKAYHLA